MRLRVRITPGRREPETITLFGCAAPPPRRRCLPWLGSVAAHAVFFAGVSVAGDLDSWFDNEKVDLSAYKVEYIRLRVPDPLYYSRSEPERRPAPPKRRKELAAAAPPSTAGGLRGPGAARRFQLPPTIEVPVAPGPSKVEAVILQPEFRVEPRVPAPVPSLAFWARLIAPPPKPVKRLVLPGRREEAAPPASLSAPPVLAVSNREATIGRMNVASAAAPPSPALPVTPAATVPVRMRDASAEARTGPLDPVEGDAANVIALTAEAMPANRVVAVPQGLTVRGQGGAGEPGGSGGEDGAAEKDRRQAADPGREGSREQAAAKPAGGAGKAKADAARTNGSGAADAEASGRREVARQTAPAAPGAASPGADSHAGAAQGGKALAVAVAQPSTVARTPADTVPVTRLKHSPSGLFDVVIMQSSAGEEVQEAEGVLTGSPVYTVYLPVGGEKEWRLLFCLAARPAPKGGTYQVNAEDAAPLTPPYPVSTVVPTAILTQERPKYAILHGLLTAAGKLRNMAAADRNPVIAQIVPLLEQWEFRPAQQAGTPVDVEILLAIPPRT